MIKRFLILLSMVWVTCGQAATFTDLKFGQAQIADSQWNVNACMNTNTCQIYSKNPGTAYKIPWTSGQLTWTTGDYVAFAATGDSTNPYNAVQYNSAGVQKAVMGAGRIINMGADYFFFVGSDNNTGQLFSMTSGLSNTAGVTWTGTLNPTIAQVNAYAANGSTTPLAAGQTVAPSFDGTITQTNSSNSTYSGSTGSISTSQQTRATAWANKTLGSGNNIELDVNGSNNIIYIEQVGNTNLIQGLGSTAAPVTGNSNSVTVKQGTTGSGQNEIDLRVAGNSNTLDIGQARTSTGTQTGTNGHYQSVDVIGYNNTVTTQQSNTTTGSHYQETTVYGNRNSVVARQTDNSSKTMFSTAIGDDNTINATQKGSAQHQLTATLTGNNNSASVVQEGSTQNKANIDLTNAGGAASLDLQQTGGKIFSIIQSCTNPAGCSTTVRQ